MKIKAAKGHAPMRQQPTKLTNTRINVRYKTRDTRQKSIIHKYTPLKIAYKSVSETNALWVIFSKLFTKTFWKDAHIHNRQNATTDLFSLMDEITNIHNP